MSIYKSLCEPPDNHAGFMSTITFSAMMANTVVNRVLSLTCGYIWMTPSGNVSLLLILSSVKTTPPFQGQHAGTCWRNEVFGGMLVGTAHSFCSPWRWEKCLLLLLLPATWFAHQEGLGGTAGVIGYVLLQYLHAVATKRLCHRASREQSDSLATVALALILLWQIFSLIYLILW